MISIAVYALLSNVPAVQSAVGNRVWPRRAQAPSKPPFVVYGFAGGTRWHSLTGPSGLTQARVQVDVYAAGYLEARTLAAAIHAALNGFRGEVPVSDDSPQEMVRIGSISAPVPPDDSEEPNVDPPLFRVRQDFLIIFDEE